MHFGAQHSASTSPVGGDTPRLLATLGDFRSNKVISNIQPQVCIVDIFDIFVVLREKSYAFIFSLYALNATWIHPSAPIAIVKLHRSGIH